MGKEKLKIVSRQGGARQGMAWLGVAGQGVARRGMAWSLKSLWLVEARTSVDRKGKQNGSRFRNDKRNG